MLLWAVVFQAVAICWVETALGTESPLVVQVWPGKAPDENAPMGEERVLLSDKLDRSRVEVTEQTRMITGVTKPTLMIFRPAKDKETGAAMLICPGGG